MRETTPRYQKGLRYTTGLDLTSVKTYVFSHPVEFRW